LNSGRRAAIPSVYAPPRPKSNYNFRAVYDLSPPAIFLALTRSAEARIAREPNLGRTASAWSMRVGPFWWDVARRPWPRLVKDRSMRRAALRNAVTGSVGCLLEAGELARWSSTGKPETVSPYEYRGPPAPW